MSAVPRTLATVLEDQATALAEIGWEIEGLQVVAGLNPNPTPPSIDVFPAPGFLAGAGFGIGESQVFFTVRARVSTADNAAGQRELLRMLDPRDPASVERALAAIETAVVEVSEYREYLEDAAENGRLLGAEWRVTTFL